MNKIKYTKCPLNYIGGKYKLLPQILPLLPKNINKFIDLFCGGCNVGINIDCNTIIFNDLISQLTNLYQNWKNADYSDTLKYIENRINEFELSKTNKEGYLNLRETYNKERDIRDLFVLVSYSFNHQMRFNSRGYFNMPFGLNKSDFNSKMKQNLENFVDEIKTKNCYFTNKNFNELDIDKLSSDDFVYCDPPYLITLANYNEKNAWNETREKELLSLLDKINEKGIRFALSNVLENKGKENVILKEWCKKYNVHHLNMTYGNCNYHAKDKSTNTTDEVLITNYEIPKENKQLELF